MFKPGYGLWREFNKAISHNCKDSRLPYAIKADVANFFERIYQHILINLLHAAECPPKAVNLLEKLLLAWMEKDSHGILQGMFPSDFLGNFYLCGLDSELTDRGIPSARFVDDVYLFFPSRDEARGGLVDLCRILRNDGLNLNESKSYIVESEKLLHEETELDRMFEEAREEIEGGLNILEMYGFVHIWSPEQDEELTEEDVELQAVEALFGKIGEVTEVQEEKIDRFCLPILSAAGNTLAVERALEGINIRPHLSQLYCSYLVSLVTSNPSIGKRVERKILEGALPYDWQMMWCIAVLIEAKTVATATISNVSNILRNSRSVALRSLCAILIGKHGPAARRHNLRNHYSDEPSPYVRSAVLFASKYFPTTERKTCLSTWRGHSPINSLVAKAVGAII
ncbi:MAG: RNA-directed DNA polymerase [Nitrospirales bacterium]